MIFDFLASCIVCGIAQGIGIADENAKNRKVDLILREREIESIKNSYYPEPHRGKDGKIIIENCLLYDQDLKQYGAYQTMKWAEQGRYNLEGEALKKEQERINKKTNH